MILKFLKHRSPQFIKMFAFLAIFSSVSVKADEGMWLPLLIKRLNNVDLQKSGLKLTPEEIYSVNNSSLKDAIVGLADPKYPTDFFCTAELVSKEGLLLTNHHCAFDAIQSKSSVANDYLTNGYWARTKSEELSTEKIAAVFLDRMEDVSQKVLSDVTDDMDELTRETKIQEQINKIVLEAEKNNPKCRASVKSFFFGNEFYLFVYHVYKDVRLVGTPPSAIGKFGGDTDNWMWPRHTGDFSLLRVYMGEDGSGNSYQANNIPLKSKYFLPLSNRNKEKGEFSMIMGYPAKTDRYMTSFGVEQNLRITYPTIVDIRTRKLAIIEEAMSRDAAIRIKYSSKQANTSNYWKYYIGAQKQLGRNKVVEYKKGLELEFVRWVAEDPFRGKRYGTILPRIEAAYKVIEGYQKNMTYLEEGVFQGPEIIYFAFGFSSYATELPTLLRQDNPDKQKLAELLATLKKNASVFYKDYDYQIDKSLFAALIKAYVDAIPKDQLPDELKALKNKREINTWVDEIYKKSIFSEQSRLNQFLEKPNVKVLENDPVYKLMMSVVQKYFEVNATILQAEYQITEASRYYIEALRLMYPERNFYSDANSTMRLSYGKISDYSPYDAVSYEYYTTLKGLLMKEDSTNKDYVVPKKLKTLYQNKDFGSYAQGDDIRVCFTTNNDITGGNSGSPVINGNGELVGIAFDGNWEAMSGDVAFDNRIQRMIAVDIRYVLFIIDKYAGAENIIRELEIRN